MNGSRRSFGRPVSVLKNGSAQFRKCSPAMSDRAHKRVTRRRLRCRLARRERGGDGVRKAAPSDSSTPPKQAPNNTCGLLVGIFRGKCCRGDVNAFQFFNDADEAIEILKSTVVRLRGRAVRQNHRRAFERHDLRSTRGNSSDRSAQMGHRKDALAVRRRLRPANFKFGSKDVDPIFIVENSLYVANPDKPRSTASC